ncbi:MAG: M28 family peptidase, partial [Candidatus Promineifilaceae bacterium]
YDVDTTPFKCLDYTHGEVALVSGGKSFEVFVSPYSLGCDVPAEVVAVSSVEELEDCRPEGKILLMNGAICAEQLMPKNFVFYNPEHHQKTIALLERKKPAAIITATVQNPELVGALYPFPLIVDGDFNIPVAYCTDRVGEEIVRHSRGDFRLYIQAERLPSTASNVIARKNPGATAKIVITAHIDAYEDTPGASDNASGTVILMLLAEMLSGYQGEVGVEIAAFNGEDHYSAGGQMDYLDRYRNDLDKIIVVINVDDVGYIKGRSTYSLYGCPPDMLKKVESAFDEYNGIIEGEPWFNGDHMIFVQSGVPSIAFTAELMPELMATVTHTPADRPELVDPQRLVEVARALESLVSRF